jgi:hypothetical protein
MKVVDGMGMLMPLNNDAPSQRPNVFDHKRPTLPVPHIVDVPLRSKLADQLFEIWAVS